MCKSFCVYVKASVCKSDFVSKCLCVFVCERQCVKAFRCTSFCVQRCVCVCERSPATKGSNINQQGTKAAQQLLCKHGWVPDLEGVWSQESASHECGSQFETEGRSEVSEFDVNIRQC